MKKVKTIKGILTFAAAVMVSASMATSAKAANLQEHLAESGIDLGVSASMDVYSKYIWRGFNLDDDVVLQPAVAITLGGFEVGFWGSWGLDDGSTSDEVDGWIGYNFDLGVLSEDFAGIGVSLGHTWYDFPELDAYTKETYLTVSFDEVAFAPYITWFHDYEDEDQGGADGNYLMIGAGHSIDLVEDGSHTLDLGVEVGFNDEAFIAGDGGYVLFTLGSTTPVTENLSITPTIGYSIPFGDLEDSSDGNQDDEFYGGLAIAMDF